MPSLWAGRLRGALTLGRLATGLIAAGAALASTIRWKVEHSPNAGASSDENFLYSVAAGSANSVWAAGAYAKSLIYRTLILQGGP